MTIARDRWMLEPVSVKDSTNQNGTHWVDIATQFTAQRCHRYGVVGGDWGLLDGRVSMRRLLTSLISRGKLVVG